MKLNFKNTLQEHINIYIEPSTDHFILKTDDELEIVSKFDSNLNFEAHIILNGLIIWIPSGQSAVIYMNGNKLESLCEQFVW